MKPFEQLGAFVNGLALMSVFAVVILYFPEIGHVAKPENAASMHHTKTSAPAQDEAASKGT